VGTATGKLFLGASTPGSFAHFPLWGNQDAKGKSSPRPSSVFRAVTETGNSRGTSSV